jgi:hypothetical protein
MPDIIMTSPDGKPPLHKRRWIRITGAITAGFIALVAVTNATSHHPNTADAKTAPKPTVSAIAPEPKPSSSAPASHPAATASASRPAKPTTAPPSIPSAPATPAIGSTVLSASGFGSKTTASFTIPDDGHGWTTAWRVEYSFGMTPATLGENSIDTDPDHMITFQFDSYNEDTLQDEPFFLVAPPFGAGGSGNVQSMGAGTYHLQISSTMPDGATGTKQAGYWTVKVIYEG